MRFDFLRSIKKSYNWLNERHLIIAFLYALLSLWYMGPAVTKCSTTTYSFGDNTAGLIWRYNTSPDSPFWGYQDITNFPSGESLTAPTVISGTVQFVSYWVSAKIFGPVCGLNVLNLISFVSAALVMYGFIYWLTKSKYIAFLTGFIVSFAPYFQIKIGAHPVYGFQAIFIGLIWLSCALYRKPTLKKSVSFGILAAVGIFSDPYFVLLISILIGAIFLSFIGGKYIQKNKKTTITSLIKSLKHLIAAGIIVSSALSVLVVYKYVNQSKIDSYVSNARGNVLYEARACSNFPHEYFMPFAYHFVYKKFLGRTYVTTVEKAQDGLSCGYGEDTVGINPIALLSVLILPLIITWEYINKRRYFLAQRNRFILWVMVMLYVVALVSALFALPPYKIHGISTPSQLILDLTTTWRTINRLYVLVNIAVCALFGITLWLVSKQKNFTRNFKRISYVLILLFTLVQYQIFEPLKGNSMATFNYSTDANPAYYYLRDYPASKVIAEYPLEKYGGESDAMSYYLTMQTIHGKKLLNGIISNSYQEFVRSGLKDLLDPQTIPSLRSLGVDTLVVHGLKDSDLAKIEGTEIVYISKPSKVTLSSLNPTIKEDYTAILKILPGIEAKNSIMLIDGFPRNGLITESSISWSYEVQTGAKIKINTFKDSGMNNTCMKMRTALDVDSLEVTITDQNGNEHKYHLNGNPVTVYGWANGADEYMLTSSNLHNMRITELGCR